MERLYEWACHTSRAAAAAVAMALMAGAAPGMLAAQEGSAIHGRVTGRTGEPIRGATVAADPVAAPELRRTVITGPGGAYRISGLAPGRYTVRAERVGLEAHVRQVSLNAAQETRLDFRLAPGAVTLDPLTATGRSAAERERTRFETEAGVTTRVIGGGELKILPGMGEADVLRAVELLPGVISTSDFSSAFNVRGGSADQNLILLDGFPIFNPFHLGGLFSVFNADVIARAELLAGGFGAEYGGRVSSVLSVESETGADDHLRGDAGVSLIATRLALHSNLPSAVGTVLGGEGGSWFLSGRRSYFDQLLKPVVDFPYHLTDLQGAVTLGTAGGGRVRVIGYSGEDVLDLSDFTPPGAEEDEESILRIQWNWGNDVVGVRWEQPLGAWTMDTRLGYSRFAEALGFVEFDDTRFESRIDQLGLRVDFGRPLRAGLTVKVGGEAASVGYRNFIGAGGTEFFRNGDNGTLTSAYGQLRWIPSERWIVEPGLRADGWFAGSSDRLLLSPRLGIKRFFGAERDGALKLSLGRYVQFLHSLRDENLPVSNDRWVLANDAVPAVVSDQAQIGVEKYWGNRWYASVEAYHRDFDGVTDLNYADDPNDPADDLLTGEGSSYGLDMLVRRSAGRLTGWTTVSLLRAERTFPDPLTFGVGDTASISYPPIFDRRADIELILQYQLPWKLESGARWNFGSGLPYTRPAAQYFGWEYDIAEGRYEPSDRGGVSEDIPLFVVLGGRNAERYPAYHRLDVTLRRPFARRWGSYIPYLQVLNAYNQQNVLFYFHRFDRTPPTRSGFSMFPVLPTIGVDVTF